MKKEFREKVWKKYDYKCAYCGEDLEYKKMQVDHIEAKYLGGKDNIENYNPSCRQCNFYKGTFSLDGFKKQLATITERIKKPFIARLAIKYGLISFKPFDGEFFFEKYNKALAINVVSRPLPDDFWFSDENGIEVTVINYTKDWCMVKNDNKEEPYILPFEFVYNIYKDSIEEGNDC